MDPAHIRAIAEAVADGDLETRRQLEARCESLEARLVEQAERHAAAMIEMRSLIDQARADLVERVGAAEQATVTFLERDTQTRQALRDELAAAVAQIRDEHTQPAAVTLDQPAAWTDLTVALARGSLVTHKGSTFIANREAYGSPSDEPASWTLVAAGFHLEGAEQSAEREITLHLRNGFDLVELKVPFPGAPLYRGLWEERAYETGDMVTLDGSMWACLTDTDTRPPGDAWRLAVKRGERARAPLKVVAP
jgi:hypothetical protein